MIKLGVLDFDTSHVVEFTRRLNHIGDKEQWVDGAQVVIGCPGESKMMADRIPGYEKQMREWGVPLVQKPEEMIGKVDGMLIESVQGSQHLARAKPFLEAGIPCFIDKPFANSTADARQLIALSEKHQAPIFSSSSLRYAPELVKFMDEPKHGKVTGVLTYGPASLHEGNPGLFHYGIHATEMLFTLMGAGCDRVTCTLEAGAEVVTGHWKDGRVASVRGLRAGKSGLFGFVAFTDQGVFSVPVGTRDIYRELLKQVVRFFHERKAPVDTRVTFEIVAFIEAALASAGKHGGVVEIRV
jgi:predicted dehydrogenase